MTFKYFMSYERMHRKIYDGFVTDTSNINCKTSEMQDI